MKKTLKHLSALLSIVLVLFCLLPCAAAVEYGPVIDLTLLETEAHPNANNNVETRQERHERLISEGYELLELTVANRSRNSHIEGPDGNLYETRVVTSTYTQPTHTSTRYGEEFLNIITQANVSIFIDFGVSDFLDYVANVGWIPSLLGINTQTLADFISRGQVRYIENSTVYFYDIEVRLAETTGRFYFVASSEKTDVALTATSSWYSSSGQPHQETISGSKSSRSPFYGSELGLGEIAVECFVTGGRYGDYLYIEESPPINHIPLS